MAGGLGLGLALTGAMGAIGEWGAGGGQSLAVNLGGEGEISGVINQNGPWILEDDWTSSRYGLTLQELQEQGNQFVISSNTNLPFASGSVGTVYTNSVPIDINSFMGPGVQSSEIQRILAPGGVWINIAADGTITRTTF